MGLDTVEILLCVEAAFGITIGEAEAQTTRTPAAIAALVCEKLGVTETGSGLPLMREFYRIRHTVAQLTGRAPREIRMTSRFTDILPRAAFHEWSRRFANDSIRAPGLSLWDRRTVADILTEHLLGFARHKHLTGAPWTRAEVRCVTRAAITRVIDVRRFSDDADLIRDLGAC